MGYLEAMKDAIQEGIDNADRYKKLTCSLHCMIPSKGKSESQNIYVLDCLCVSLIVNESPETREIWSYWAQCGFGFYFQVEQKRSFWDAIGSIVCAILGVCQVVVGVAIAAASGKFLSFQYFLF